MWRVGAIVGALVLGVACGSDSAPPGHAIVPAEVRFGDTAAVVVVNLPTNSANKRKVANPGQYITGVRMASDDGIPGTTNAKGVAVLAPLSPGKRTIIIAGGAVGGAFSFTMVPGGLRDLAVATLLSSAQATVNLEYRSDHAIELYPTNSISDVNNALLAEDAVVFLHAGVYVGDIDLAGSRVTLFGEGVLGAEQVQLRGNVTVSGNGSRIRGAVITGNLTITASDTAVLYSRVTGDTSLTGSDGILLANSLCGNETITGGNALLIGNTGAPPMPPCP